MTGIGISPGPEIDDSLKEEVARKRLQEVSEEYDLGVEDVDVEFDPSLPYRVLGRTTRDYSGDIEISVGKSFLDANEYEQLKTMLHEGVHVKQFRGEVGDWLREDLGTSEEFAREAERSTNFYDRGDLEGITEVITGNLLPFNSGSGYPYHERRKEMELASKGIDVESELVDDMEDEVDALVENYKTVYDSIRIGEVYLETGEINGIGYSAVALGYDGESAVDEYLQGLAELDFDESYSVLRGEDEGKAGV